MLSFVRQCSGIASSTSLKNFCLDMKRRGLISLILPDNFLDSSSKGGYDSQQLPNVLYAGFDPTASSFHVGNLLILTSLFRSSLMGCSPIALIGGATALIGDPSGRIKDRPELSREFVNENSECLTKQLQNMWRNLQAVRNVRNDKNLIILNNIEWYNNMSVIEFLRLARCFRISEMLRMGHVKSRPSIL
uniref:Tyrosine--tRNA ligase n=1 Tax=Acrobeloides nanus TaxID=290746 RepID=A0A914CZR4_9BILA